MRYSVSNWKECPSHSVSSPVDVPVSRYRPLGIHLTLLTMQRTLFRCSRAPRVQYAFPTS